MADRSVPATPDDATPAHWSPPPGHILSEPATTETCRADYAAAADVRQTMAQQDRRQR